VKMSEGKEKGDSGRQGGQQGGGVEKGDERWRGEEERGVRDSLAHDRQRWLALITRLAHKPAVLVTPRRSASIRRSITGARGGEIVTEAEPGPSVVWLQRVQERTGARAASSGGVGFWHRVLRLSIWLAQALRTTCCGEPLGAVL